MRNRIILFLLLISSHIFGQTSVPNTETFSLNDVYTAVHAHTPSTIGTLQSCFDNAISSYFNVSYNQDSYAPANSMLRFRDYKPISNPCDLPTFVIYEEIQVSACGTYDFSGSLALATQACADANNASCASGGFIIGGPGYHIESFTIGKQLYSASGDCSANSITGYGLYKDGTTWYITHTTNGIIDLKTQCYP